MNNIDYIRQYLQRSIDVKQKLLGSTELVAKLSELSDLVVETYKRGGKVLIAGNGGSAADAQHIAAELVSRFFFDRPGLPAIALTTDTSMLTAIGNDYGFEHVFSRQVEANGASGDIFIGISTSGNSKNVIKAVEAARERGLTTVVFCGEGGALKGMVDHAVAVPSSITPHIQEAHICIGHVICALVEERMYGAA